MQLVVLEFLCGGGLAGDTESPSSHSELRNLFGEGLGMLRCLLEDLTLCGHRVSTVIDSRAVVGRDLEHLCSIAEVSLFDASSLPEKGFQSKWLEVARNADRVLVIAPEIGGELQRVTRLMEREGVRVWGATGRFLDHGSDKLAMAASLPPSADHPKTWSANDWVAAMRVKERELELLSNDGWVWKDRWGAGCADMRWFPSAGALKNWLECSQESRFRQMGGSGKEGDGWIVQPWRSGVPASLAMVADGRTPARLVGCMGQRIQRRETVQYTGGFGPILEDRFELLERWARDVVAPYDGVRGWFGLDLVIRPADGRCDLLAKACTPDEIREIFRGAIEWSLIEINPRLTTSYLGWREIYGPALAEGVFGISQEWTSCRRTEKQVIFPVPCDKG